MLETLRHRRWHWIAPGAAWLLVAQLLLGGFMQGLSAAPAAAGANIFGMICSSTGGDAALPADQPAGHRLPNCCLLGCPALSIAALPPQALLRIEPLGTADLTVGYAVASPVRSQSDRSTVRARGPPISPA